MNTKRSVRIIQAAVVVAGLSLAACASANKAAVRQASAESGRYMAAGDFQKAIDVQKKLCLKDPGDKKVLASYVTAVEEIKRAADLARGRGNYGPAAGTYRLLVDNWEGYGPIVARLTFKKSDLETGLRSCRVAIGELQGRQEMGARNYEKAIGIYQAALKDYPGEKSLRAGYAAAVGEIKALADTAFAAHDYASAGKLDRLLLKNLASFEGLETAASLSGDDLAETLKLCSFCLTNRGLAEYRKGNLEKAIAVWEELLVFDAENMEIKKAVETAKAQLAKLKSMVPGGPGRS